MYRFKKVLFVFSLKPVYKTVVEVCKCGYRQTNTSKCPSDILRHPSYSMQNAKKMPFHLSSRCSTYFSPSISLFFLPYTLPWWQPSHCTDVCACPLWYSGIRFSWWPRSGTNNLFNPLIIISGINKFAWKTAPWTLNPYSRLKFIFPPFFPVAWWWKVSFPQPLYLPVFCGLCSTLATNPLAEWDEYCNSAYAIFKGNVFRLD